MGKDAVETLCGLGVGQRRRHTMGRSHRTGCRWELGERGDGRGLRLVVCVDEPFPKGDSGAPRWPAGAHSGLHIAHPLEQNFLLLST